MYNGHTILTRIIPFNISTIPKLPMIFTRKIELKTLFIRFHMNRFNFNLLKIKYIEIDRNR